MSFSWKNVLSFSLSLGLVISSSACFAQDNLATFKSGVEGMKLLRDRAVLFYNQKGYLPSNQELLETPLGDKNPIESGLLNKHYIKLLYVRPLEGPCPAIMLQGTISDDTNVAKDTDPKDVPNILNNLLVTKVDGSWVTICSYNASGPNVDPTSFKIDYCYNMDIPADKSHVEKQIRGLMDKCG